MSAPNGFNEHASNLPDPGAAAVPIHVMRGGGGSTAEIPEQSGGVEFSMKDEAIFDEMGLNDSMITQHIDGFDDEFKRAFLRQYLSGECDTKGNSITKKDCWAYAKLVGALIKANITRGAATSLPGMVPEGNLTKIPTEPSPTAPIPLKIGTPTGVDPLANNENDDDTFSDAARLAANAARRAAAADDDSLAPCIREETDASDRDGDSDMDIHSLIRNIDAAERRAPATKLEQEEKVMMTDAMITVAEPAEENVRNALRIIFGWATSSAGNKANGSPPTPRDILTNATAAGATLNGLIASLRGYLNESPPPEPLRRTLVNAFIQVAALLVFVATPPRGTTKEARKATLDTARTQIQGVIAAARAIDAAPPATAGVPPAIPATPPSPPSPPAASSTPSGRMDGSEYNFPANEYSRALAENIVARGTSSPTPTPSPAPASAVALTDDYFLENPANFRKGQFGMNFNTTNNSKRVYANAIVGTKRMRIRGSNAANIKRRYNAKKQGLVTEAERLRTARATAAEREATTLRQKQAVRTGTMMQEMLAKQRRNAAIATQKAAEKNLRNTRKAQKKTTKNEEEVIRRAEVAAGIQKPSFMNRMRSIKNPFKRGGSSRKTRRSTRRNRRR